MNEVRVLVFHEQMDTQKNIRGIMYGLVCVHKTEGKGGLILIERRSQIIFLFVFKEKVLTVDESLLSQIVN